MNHITYHSPFGPIRLSIESGRLERVCPGRFGPADASRSSAGRHADPDTGVIIRFLDGYFSGETAGARICWMNLSHCTPFQKRVYEELLQTGFGCTVTYGDLARSAGSTHAARAVGGVMAANRFPVFIPCHRVIRSDGGIGGFTAGHGWKKALIEHEAAFAGQTITSPRSGQQ